MEKNTFTGLFIIALILIGWSFFMKPTQPEINQYKKQSDSIELAKKGIVTSVATDSTSNTATVDTGVIQKPEFITLENELMKVTLTTKGGRVYATELKGQKTADGKPVILFNGDDNRFGFKIPLTGRNLITNDEFFKPLGSSINVAGTDSNSVTLRLAVSATQYIDYVYSLKGKSYLLGYNVKMVGMNQLIAPSTKNLTIEWSSALLQQEKDIKSERQYSTVYYKPLEDKADYLSETKDKEEKTSSLKWVAFKQHFFSSVLIANNEITGSTLNTETDLTKSTVKKMTADLSVPYQSKAEEVYGMQFYFGPNHFTTLKATGYDLQQLIKLGWGPLGFINRWAVIPLFNFLNGFNMNYGIIILLLTVILKLVLLPLTYSSYKSQAKMRILKPEMDAIKAKVGEEDQTRLQQEYMKLYKQAGVNPLAGCVPLLLQMPILFAFFKFFPASFELRQQSFLWVKDLSTFDSAITWGTTLPIIGNHISLMCVLMTISTLIYTWMNNKISGVSGQMKYLGYIMPVMFMGVLNSFPAGLNYYYFCANMITFGQQFLIRKFVNEDAIHAQLEQNKKRPEANKKSKWQMRLEEMSKQQQQRAVKK
ncbi:membrane protein insertase YidC [Solitalea koreensis]|uniref:Membrane protein insertase YidC n=1 Tax=Solitalea koreensis TaxID=543615 RepID=A0A521DB77_9SPHI|nr:membrane protein insertase YidC [Solitalea koreensis]SMO68994.1 YidC/Oxa1 family membrane protein insertase [Solitalea koreensis]